MFVLKAVKHTYKSIDERNVQALRGVDLHIPAGSLFALVGANGSGKSTVAQHLNALLLPDEGQVFIDGMLSADSNNTAQIRRTVGYVMQDPDNQIIASSVEDDIAFGPENLGLPREEIAARIKEVLSMVGLSGFEKRNPVDLSGGQKQRVAIAGALALKPKAIILDEATAMLDPVGKAEVWSVISDLRKEGITVVLVTHDAAEMLMCDHIAVLKDGVVVRTAAPRDIFAEKDMLDEWNIELPSALQMASLLKDYGCDVDFSDVITIDELVGAICR